MTRSILLGPREGSVSRAVDVHVPRPRRERARGPGSRRAHTARLRRWALSRLHLQPVQAGVEAAAREQLVMSPSSTMRPWSRTTMRSARRMVDRRWAMTIDVRPRISSAMPRSIRRSNSGSTLAVASSRISSRGSRHSARAKAISWRSPAEKFAPAFRRRGASRPPGRARGDDPIGAHAARRLPASAPVRRRDRPARCSRPACPRTGTRPG